MKHTIPGNILSKISDLISSHLGLHFHEDRWDELERGIVSSATDFGYRDVWEFVSWLSSSDITKSHIEVLASHLTVGETYFFRDPDTFKAIEEHIIPELAGSPVRRVRIWCAGCSTGEEPYSIAILLKKGIPEVESWNITILATDINPISLRKASAGRYTEWSFRSTPEWIKSSYFTKAADGLYDISPGIKEMVDFEYHNLAEDGFPSLLHKNNAMDLVICRNVLMYFSHNRAKKVIHGFHNSLVDNGWLLVSPIDAIQHIAKRFRPVSIPGAVIYRKGRTQDEPREARMAYTVIPFTPAGAIAPAGPGSRPRVTPEKKEPAGAGRAEPKTDPRYQKALLFFREGRYAEAARLLEAIASKENSSPVHELLARAYANIGRLDDAVKSCAASIAAEILNPASHYLLATILLEQGRLEEAVQSLKKALYLDPGFVLSYFVLGNLMQRKGDGKAAAKCFSNAQEILSGYRPDDILPESEGVTAGRLSEIISSMSSGSSNVRGAGGEGLPI